MCHENVNLLSRSPLEACLGLDVTCSKGKDVDCQTSFALPLYQATRATTLLFHDRWQYPPLPLHLEQGLWVRFVGLRIQT